MLCIGRKKNEAFVLIYEGKIIARVLVTDVKPDKAKLGIEAEQDVRIIREELLSREKQCPTS